MRNCYLRQMPDVVGAAAAIQQAWPRHADRLHNGDNADRSGGQYHQEHGSDCVQYAL